MITIELRWRGALLGGIIGIISNLSRVSFLETLNPIDFRWSMVFVGFVSSACFVLAGVLFESIVMRGKENRGDKHEQ